MLADKQFRFHKDTIAIVTTGGERVTETIPGGAVVKVIGNPRHGEGEIDVLQDGPYDDVAVDFKRPWHEKSPKDQPNTLDGCPAEFKTSTFDLQDHIEDH